jgi:gas vesicle protein
MKSFLIGLGVGIGVGVLFAPMSGEETRGRLTDSASDLADSARDTMEHGRERMQRGVSAIRNATDRVSSTVANTVSNATGEKRPTGTESAKL